MKLIRTRKEMNQLEFAEILGVSQNYLSLIESNKRRPSDDKLNAFAESLGISKEALIFAASNIPQELSRKDKTEYKKLQNNITTLLLFGIDGDFEKIEEN